MKLRMFRILLAAAVLSLGTIVALAQMVADTPSKKGSERTTPILAGAVAPDFTLPDVDGKEVSLTDLRAGRPVVVVFYRGSWCPFCRRQLSELRTLAATVKNARVVTISVDTPAATKKFAAQITADGKGAIAFTMLSDTSHKVIDAYGLHDANYDGQEFDGIPQAAVYIIGPDGKVAWARISPDYRKRPTNDDIQTALAALK